MGKGYNNYMCKKPFHPGSKANIKRTWMAEQRTENEKKKQDDLKVQYEKEQELYNNRALISTESKDKLELNFMYEAPPGAKRERQKEDDEPEYKFEWQRKYNAPREDFAKGNTEIRDQPFGIPVRNVRCIKCHKWGHINTDKECPLFSQASTSSMPTTSMDPLELMRQMREDGYNLKQSVLGHHLNPQAANQQLLESEEEEDPEREFLRSLTTKQKHKLLKKLNKITQKHSKSESSCGKKKKNKKKHKNKRKSSESESEHEKEKKKAKKTVKGPTDSSDESSNSKDSRDEKIIKQKVKKSAPKNSSSSESCDSEEEKTKRKKDSKKSLSTKDKQHSGGKSKKHKGKGASVSSKDVNLKHGMKKNTKNDSKNSTSDGSSDTEVKVDVKQEVAGTSATYESKRKCSDSSSSSGGSGRGSSPEGHLSKRPKIEEPKSENPCPVEMEASCSQTQGTNTVSTEKSSTAVQEGCMDEMSKSPEHPDRFMCSTSSPQAPETGEKLNLATLLLGRKYHGDRDEKFRRINRDRRSPSFKQKYRLT